MWNSDPGDLVGAMTVSGTFLNYLFSYVTELTDRIRTRSSSDQDELEDSDEFVSFFPDFVWTLRDFSLELKVNGKPISADEYLENSLRLIQGKRLITPKWGLKKTKDSDFSFSFSFFERSNVKFIDVKGNSM